MAASNGESTPSDSKIDLVGGPFSVIESDPGVFTCFIRKLGIRGIEVEEVYDIQPWGLDHLKPKGLIMCFNWKHDNHHPRDFLDPAAKGIWFANQLVSDACASLAILNVLFNCPDIELGEELTAFKNETFALSPKMRGLAISNSQLLRETQNSFARPADTWVSFSATAEATRDLYAESKKPAKKKVKLGIKRKTKKKYAETEPDAYHFVGYVAARGKVWELDGLKSGPLEVGELPYPESSESWEDIVRPALRLKMQKYGGENIQFNLLALVQDRYETKSDELELLKREKGALERRLKECYGENWQEKVDEDLLSSSEEVFSTLAQLPTQGPTFARDFGARWMERAKAIIDMSPDDLSDAWQSCVNKAMPITIAINEEVQKAVHARNEIAKRTYDYEPFIREFLVSLHNEGLLAQHIDRS